MNGPYYADDTVTVHHGDCLDIMATLPDASVDAIVTDPPYGLGFMGREWDDLPPGEPWARECLRVLKPGGHLLAFGGSRTWHRLAVAVEDAGFEVRDSIAWLYGSGFPKSLDVSKAIDKRRDWAGIASVAAAIRSARAEAGMSLREVGDAVKTASGGVHGEWYHRGGHMFFETGMSLPGRAEWRHLRAVLPIPAELDAVFDAAEREVVQERTMTQGGGTSLQMRMGEAREVRADITAPATLDAQRWQGWGTALKPAFEPIVVARKPLAGTVAGNVLAYGTGALNVDGCRVEGVPPSVPQPKFSNGRDDLPGHAAGRNGEMSQASGRWPTNVVLDDTQAAELDRQSGVDTSRPQGRPSVGTVKPTGGTEFTGLNSGIGYTDTGGASRFFPTFRYEAKAPTAERPRAGEVAHPTVKPLDLMRWLVRLVTPPGGVVLEPFAGSGTTAEACVLEGLRCIAIEREADYLPLIVQRLSKPLQVGLDLGGIA